MPWYVVRTKPRHELKSAKILENLGMDIYCPVVTEVRQWSDRKKKVTMPLFKSYLFVQLDLKNRSDVFQAPGILCFVDWLEKPAIVRDDEIEIIKTWLNNETLGDFELTNFKKGDEIEIKNGSLANKKAIIQGVGTKKLKLILSELGWTLTVNIQDVI
ncbi:transcription antitermination factor NusG [Gillisia sp. Hel_I_86]|uniref:transcription termination/antitermination protein NusG n=1 Tax=Gillisia sp. Hel_I_86 TaxID=1249981 RepID=UPI00119AE019|nr:UpxY family transcription antiterminator [Gillisia sp. Hel_I_86]TVZ26053.1 transcription antitermination factor NusG [Gillisia sp. Hel_I_86]